MHSLKIPVHTLIHSQWSFVVMRFNHRQKNYIFDCTRTAEQTLFDLLVHDIFLEFFIIYIFIRGIQYNTYLFVCSYSAKKSQMSKYSLKISISWHVPFPGKFDILSILIRNKLGLSNINKTWVHHFIFSLFSSQNTGSKYWQLPDLV